MSCCDRGGMFSALDDGRSAQALPTALVGVDGIALLGWHGLARASQFTCHVLTLGQRLKPCDGSGITIERS